MFSLNNPQSSPHRVRTEVTIFQNQSVVLDRRTLTILRMVSEFGGVVYLYPWQMRTRNDDSAAVAVSVATTGIGVVHQLRCGDRSMHISYR